MTANNIESGTHQAEDELAKWIGLYQQVQLPSSYESWVHRSFADLIAARGRFFRAEPWAIPEPHPGRQGQCFRAANEWADRQGWIYVEGFAFLPTAPVFMSVIDYAWCLTENGHVADPALEDGQADGYFGVPVTHDFRRQRRIRRGA
ncbi:hypothetical protein [Nocardia testacea]|uniref:hypothetical protein n=1 Tax=Nocardia testacea TaxID=248551 RepID=UPI0012F6CE50|nr:hypothetical protein [Nocardia testacea]